MSRAVLIFNPAAARADPEVVRGVCRVFAVEGWKIDAARTTRPGDAGVLADQAVTAGVDLVAVYGGDGTAMQAMSAIVGREMLVGLIPGGTGNLLAGNLRLPRDPLAAARVIVRGTPRRIDLGRVARPEGVRYFAVACGAGVDAEIMAATSGSAKRRWGMAAYVARGWKALIHLQAVEHHVVVDGEAIEADGAMVLVANCREIIPPFIAIRKDTSLDDGLLDVVIIKASTPIQGLEVVWRGVTGLVDNNRRFQFARGERVTVETAVPRPVQMDGESAGVTPFVAEIVPGAISVVVASDGR